MGWQKKALEAMFSAMENGTVSPAEHHQRVGVDAYTSRARFDREREVAFGRFPIVVAASAELPSAGTFFTHDETGVPLLVTRDADGVVHAMLNVCRHRGARLVSDAVGAERTTLTCRYHGWTYDLNGALRSIRHAHDFPSVDKPCRGLASLHVAERAGLILVEPRQHCLFAAHDYAAPCFEQLESFGFAEREVFNVSVRTVKCNWKLFVETMLEGYHIATLHRKSGAAAFNDNVFFFEPLSEPSGRFLIPLKGAARPQSEEDWQLAYHCSIVYWLFPNTFVFVFGRFAHVIGVYPVAVDQCRVTSRALISFADQQSESQRESFKLLHDWYWSTIDEDIEVVESVQECIGSGANEDFVLGRSESAIATQLHDYLNRVCEPA